MVVVTLAGCTHQALVVITSHEETMYVLYCLVLFCDYFGFFSCNCGVLVYMNCRLVAALTHPFILDVV